MIASRKCVSDGWPILAVFARVGSWCRLFLPPRPPKSTSFTHSCPDTPFPKWSLTDSYQYIILIRVISTNNSNASRGVGRFAIPTAKFHSSPNPVESADPKNTPVTLLQSADPKTRHLKSFRIRTYKIRRGEGSAVGFFAVTDGDDFNGVIAFQIEEDVVVAATQTEAGKRRLQQNITCAKRGALACSRGTGIRCLCPGKCRSLRAACSRWAGPLR
jgi:hypothetical protein